MAPKQLMFAQVVINSATDGGFIVTYSVLDPPIDAPEDWTLTRTAVFQHWTQVVEFLRKGVKV